MKVVKHGRMSGEEHYKVSCRNCRAVIEFTRDEAHHKFDEDENRYLVIKCPDCGNDVHRSLPDEENEEE